MSEGVHEHRLRVRYAETDQMGVVHHRIHLVYLEEARTEYMERLGCPYAGIEAAGVGLPVRRVDLSARVSGTVLSVSARTGETVKAGADLVSIDVEDLDLQVEQQRATLASALARHDAAVSDLARKRQLAERGLLSKADLQVADTEAATLASDITALQAQLQQAEANLGRARISAPFDGIVATRAVEPGQTIASGTTLLSIVDPSEMIAEVAVPLSGSAQIRVGQAVELSVRGMEGQIFPASVERINPVAEDGTRSVKVFLTLPNLDGSLRGGMFVAGDIQVAASYDAIAVPDSAVTENNNDDFVMAVRDGLALRRPVVVAKEWPDVGMVEIADGLEPGDVVLAARLPHVVDGSKVHLVEHP